MIAALIVLAGLVPAPEFALAAVPAVVTQASAIVGQPQGTPLSGDRLDARTELLAAQIRCPVCQGSSIGDSPSSTARDMKALVRQLLAAGFTEEQTISYFVASYGDFIREKPRRTGFEALVWLTPPLLFVAGAFLVALWWKRRARLAPVAVAADDGDADPELDEWLRKVRAMSAGENR